MQSAFDLLLSWPASDRGRRLRFHARPFLWPLLIIVAAFAADKLLYYGFLPLANSTAAKFDYFNARIEFGRNQSQSALDSIRAALLRDRTSPSSWRLAAEISERLDSPDATYCWQQLDQLRPGNGKTQIQFAESALRHRQLDLATAALNEITDTTTISYRCAAARLADACGDEPRARDLFSSVEADHPTDPKTLLAIARWHAESAQPADLAQARRLLLPLLSDPSSRNEAFRLLVAVSVKSGHLSEAQEWSDQLLACGPATIADRVERLNFRPGSAFASELAELMEATQPREIMPVAEWMIAHGRAEAALIWIRSQPEEIQNDPIIGSARADGLAALGLWEHLRQIQAADFWPGHEPQRLMYLARACEQAGSEPDARAAWQDALLACRDYPDYFTLLDYLASIKPKATSASFRTDAQAQVWSRMISRYPNQAWLAHSLLQYSLARRDSLAVENCWAQIAALDPKDCAAAARAALISLLRNSRPEKASDTLARLRLDHPSDPVVATAESYDLSRQGRFADALAAVGGLTPEQLDAPERAVYLGALLAVAGPIDRAQQHLQVASAQPQLLDEERALINRSWDFIRYREAIAAVLDHPSGAAIFPTLASSKNPRPPVFIIGESVEIIRSGRSAEAEPLLAGIDPAMLDPAALSIFVGALLDLLGHSQAALAWLKLSPDLPFVTTAEKSHRILELWWTLHARAPSDLNAVAGLFAAYRALDACENDPAFWLRDEPRQMELVRFALLHGIGITAAQDRLHALLRHVPFTPEIQAQFAYALLLQGRAEAARQRMEILAAADLAKPEPALYYGVILAACGDQRAAQSCFQQADRSGLMPDERALLARAEKSP
jgi:Flp pilus assembly protein TadD/Tfp pilus assembly protein PilF